MCVKCWWNWLKAVNLYCSPPSMNSCPKRGSVSFYFFTMDSKIQSKSNKYKTYRVCQGFRLTKRVAYFWVDFDPFWSMYHFLMQLGQYWKLVWAWGRTTIGKFNLHKSLKRSVEKYNYATNFFWYVVLMNKTQKTMICTWKIEILNNEKVWNFFLETFFVFISWWFVTKKVCC